MSGISFDVTDQELLIIERIVERAAKASDEAGCPNLDRLSLTMDLCACHANGCPLKLEELARADDFNFAHDVFGIRNHMDRSTGKLTGCFLPRFAK